MTTPQPQNMHTVPLATVASSETMLAVLFADVVGSTRLYDTLGDEMAKRMIDECLGLLTGVVQRYGGRVIKTIGDEIMCVLPSADIASEAASDMQRQMLALPPAAQVKRSVRIGFHFGPVLEDNSDVFGDTVNLAARIAALATGMQVMTTETTVQAMSPAQRRYTRPIAPLSIKGKGDDVQVSEVIWQGDDDGLTMAAPLMVLHTNLARLELRHGAQQRVLDQTSGSLVLGRDPRCDIVLNDRNASRQHARIERRRDKFFLIDQSTNGTFLVFANEPELLVHREEVLLRGTGRVTFGHSDTTPEAECLLFTLHG